MQIKDGSTQSPDDQAVDDGAPPAPANPPAANPPAAQPPAPANPPAADPPAAQPPAAPAEGRSGSRDDDDFAKIGLTPEQRRVVGDKIGAARSDTKERAYRYVYREMGVSNLEELRGLVQQARQKTASNDQAVQDVEHRLEGVKTEAEEKIAALQRQILDLQSASSTTRQTAEKSLRMAAIRVAAIKHGFLDLDDPSRYLDIGSFPVDFDQQSVSGVEEAVADLASKRPHLIGVPKAPAPVDPAASPPNTGATPPASPPPPPAVPPTPNGSTGALTAELQEEARRQNRALVSNF